MSEKSRHENKTTASGMLLAVVLRHCKIIYLL